MGSPGESPWTIAERPGHRIMSYGEAEIPVLTHEAAGEAVVSAETRRLI